MRTQAVLGRRCAEYGVRAVGLALLGGWVVSACSIDSAGRARALYPTEKSRQEEYLETLAPAEIVLPKIFLGVPKRLRVRVYADEEFRRSTLAWEARFRGLVGRANEVLGPAFGVHLEVVDVESWNATSRLTYFEPALTQLASLDTGDDVDLVIGLLTPLPLVTASVHHLGMAYVLGRHLVLRGMDDAREHDHLVRIFGRVSSEKVEALYAARLRHKEISVLLHELGHVFGALHDYPSSSLMNPTYSHEGSTFSPPNLEVLRLGTSVRRSSTLVDQSVREKLAGLVGPGRNSDWVEDDRRALEKFLTADSEGAGKLSDGAFVSSTDSGPKCDEERISHATQLASAGDLEGAWSELEPFAEAKPDDSAIQTLACDLSARRAPKALESVERCRHAMAVDRRNPSLSLLTAHLLVLKEEPDEALLVLAEARARLERLAGSSPGESTATQWARLAELYRALSAVSLAEAAASRCPNEPEAQDISRWASEVRKAHALPTDAARALPPEIESQYLRARQAVWQAVADKRIDDAVSANAGLVARFPKLPAADGSLCVGFYEAGRPEKAKSYCERATRRETTNPRPFVVLGYLRLSEGAARQAIRNLERARELDPNDPQTWLILAAAYRVAGDRTRLGRLSREFQQKFGRPMS